MSETIVVGTDGSDSATIALREAIRLAKALKAKLHIVFGFEPRRGAQIKGAPAGAAKVYESLPDSQVESVLQYAEAIAQASGVEAETHSVQKAGADALLTVAEEVGADMIIVGSRGMHGPRRLALGNVPNRVSHNARCSVLIVATDR